MCTAPVRFDPTKLDLFMTLLWFCRPAPLAILARSCPACTATMPPPRCMKSKGTVHQRAIWLVSRAAGLHPSPRSSLASLCQTGSRLGHLLLQRPAPQCSRPSASPLLLQHPRSSRRCPLSAALPAARPRPEPPSLSSHLVVPSARPGPARRRGRACALRGARA